MVGNSNLSGSVVQTSALIFIASSFTKPSRSHSTKMNSAPVSSRRKRPLPATFVARSPKSNIYIS